MINTLNKGKAENTDYKVVVNPRPYDWNVEVWIIERRGDKSGIMSFDKTGIATITELKKNFETPTFILPQQVWSLLIEAITEETPPKKMDRLDGEITATKYHLEDLRKLLKLEALNKKEVKE